MFISRAKSTDRLLSSSSSLSVQSPVQCLKLTKIEGRGKSLVANRSIKEGETVLLEAPIAHVMVSVLYICVYMYIV